ncbi:MAG: hypothetical protein KME10_17935 [Plectolyngbya sp. WJT66-NPBG17]|jgi:hypothetical protein|nr:hypothetical protein [Plectolyngbya sp. WJT66-NPBG17]
MTVEPLSQNLESIALERFGSTTFYREVLDALNVAPFEIPAGILPEIGTFTPESLENVSAINAKVDQVKQQVDTVLADGTQKLKSVIERISWLF